MLRTTEECPIYTPKSEEYTPLPLYIEKNRLKILILPDSSQASVVSLLSQGDIQNIPWSSVLRPPRDGGPKVTVSLDYPMTPSGLLLLM